MSRVVMFVFNDCRNDARVLREAASLVAAGHTVTIMARPRDPVAVVGDREVRGGFEIVRVAVPHRWRFFWTWARYPWRMRRWWVGRVNRAIHHLPTGAAELVGLAAAAALTLVWAAIRAPFHLASRGRRVPPGGSSVDWAVRWRWSVLGWADRAAREAPPADVYHGHDLSGLEAAGRAQRRNGGALVCDSHEIFLESGTNAGRPRILKAWLARSERRWVRQAAALVTVNESLADDLGRRYGPSRTVVVHNCPARWDPPTPRPDLIRTTAGIPIDAPIALYHGSFAAHRGLEELAAALLRPGLERVHAVFLGYGSQRALLDRMVLDPRYGGRLHVLDAVPPDELLPWVASADVGVMAIQASTRNHRLSTPNKLFECLAAGLPVVVSDFDEMHRIVLDDPSGPLGATCVPDDVDDLARAIRSVVDLAPPDRAALRTRCLEAAHRRWNWETEVAGLLALYRDLPSTVVAPVATASSPAALVGPSPASGAIASPAASAIPSRVLFAARWYPAHDDPGRGIFVADLATALTEAGIDIEVASWEPALARGVNGPAEAATTVAAARERWAAVAGSAVAARPRSWGSPGVPVVRLPAIVPSVAGVERDPLELAELQAATLVPYGEAVAARRPYALIHAHTGIPDGLAASRLADRLGLPLLVTEHDSLVVGRLADGRLRDAYRRLLEGPRRVVAVSPSLRDDLARVLVVDPARIGVVPNPVDLVAFTPTGPAGRDPDELLWVGARKVSKGTDALLQAFAIARAERPLLRLRLIGAAPTPDEEGRLRGLASELGLADAVAFEPATDRAGVAAAMVHAAIFIHPSPHETFGVVAAEALASGLPVAATPSGGVESIVGTDGTCGTVADGLTAGALATAIGRTLDRRLTYDPAALRARAESFSPGAVAAATIAEYRRLLGGAEFGRTERDGATPRPRPPERRLPWSGEGSAGSVPGRGLPLVVGFNRRAALTRIAALPADLRDELEIVSSVVAAHGGDPLPAATWHEVDAEAYHRAAVVAAGGPVRPTGSAGRGLRLLLHPMRTIRLRALAGRRARMIAADRAAAVSAVLDQRVARGLQRGPLLALEADDVATLAPLLDGGVPLEPTTLRSLADRWDQAE
ncbi:MAG: glycosyltransferase [Candidatus Limnocylindrales bacterium]